jgi:hypothetical protein
MKRYDVEPYTKLVIDLTTPIYTAEELAKVTGLSHAAICNIRRQTWKTVNSNTAAQLDKLKGLI